MADYSKLISDIRSEKVPSQGRERRLTLPGGGRTGLWSVKVVNTGKEVRFDVVRGQRGTSSNSKWSEQYGNGKKHATAEEAWSALKITIMRDISNGSFEDFLNKI